MRAILLVPVALAALWSALMWGLLRLMVEPYAQVVSWSRAMDIDPNDTQWLAQLLEDGQVAIRLVIVILWALGLLAIGALAALFARGDR